MGLVPGIRVGNEDDVCDIVGETLGISVGFWLGCGIFKLLEEY